MSVVCADVVIPMSPVKRLPSTSAEYEFFTPEWEMNKCAVCDKLAVSMVYIASKDVDSKIDQDLNKSFFNLKIPLKYLIASYKIISYAAYSISVL